jgi:hypothetical protein
MGLLGFLQFSPKYDREAKLSCLSPYITGCRSLQSMTSYQRFFVLTFPARTLCMKTLALASSTIGARIRASRLVLSVPEANISMGSSSKEAPPNHKLDLPICEHSMSPTYIYNKNQVRCGMRNTRRLKLRGSPEAKNSVDGYCGALL